MRRVPIVLTTGVLLLVTACSSSSDADSSSSTTAPVASANYETDGVVPGYTSDIDIISPLVMTTVGPEPIPVTGTDNKVHVVYELEVLNYSPRPATLTQLDTLDGGADGAVVASVEADVLNENTILVVDTALTPTKTIPAGRSALILVDDTYATKADVPEAVTPRLTATFGPVEPGFEAQDALYAEGVVTQFGPAVNTSAATPVVIGPPLAGDNWVAANACCTLSSHRGSMMGIGGRINAAERYAIDWAQADVSPGAELPSGMVIPTAKGDPTKNESYFAYDEPLLAVADGTIVNVVSDMPDIAPRESAVGLRVDELGGNVVTIDIGGGVFAFYAHLVPGTATVKVGDKVTRGQVIGKLGNSGNTSEAHLHFQLQTSVAPFTGDNVPFEIDTLTLVGNFPGGVYSPGPDAGPRTNQLPLMASLVSFPALP